METLAQLQARLAMYRASEARICDSQEYQVGQGGGARRNRRVEFDQLQVAIARVEARIAAHPDNTAARAVRRVRYLRPNC